MSAVRKRRPIQGTKTWITERQIEALWYFSRGLSLAEASIALGVSVHAAHCLANGLKKKGLLLWPARKSRAGQARWSGDVLGPSSCSVCGRQHFVLGLVCGGASCQKGQP